MAEDLYILRNGNLWAIAHFLEDNGNLLLYREFCEKFQLQCTVIFFNRMIRAIPIPLRLMVKEDMLYSKISPQLRQLSLEGYDFCDKCTNKVIKFTLFINLIIPVDMEKAGKMSLEKLCILDKRTLPKIIPNI